MTFKGYDLFYNPYQNCVEKGWLEPLNWYLENTDSGKGISTIFPENYWKSLKINSEIYGIDGSLSCLKEDAGHTINAKLFDENDMDFSNFNGDYSQSLDFVIEICDDNGWTYSAGLLEYMELYTDYDFITPCLYINENGEVANIYEGEFAKKLFSTIEDGYEKGTVLSVSESPDDESKNFGCVTSSLCGGYANNNFKTNKEYGLSTGMESVEAYKIYSNNSSKIYSSSKAVGICSTSENKDLAFEAICEIMGNEKLNNLICFGPNYEVADGCVIPNGYFNTMGLENRLLRLPFNGVNDSKSNEKLLDALSEFELSDNLNFAFKVEVVSQESAKEKTSLIELLNGVSYEFKIR